MTNAAPPSPPPRPPAPAAAAPVVRVLPSAARAALAGLVAGLVAIAAGELFAGLVAGAPSIVIAVGDLVIALQPAGAKDLVVGLFGGNHKVALQVAVVVGALAIAAGAGVLARRRFDRGASVFVVAGGLALVVSLAAAGGTAEPLLVLAGVAVAVGAGLVTLRWLLTLAARAAAARAAPAWAADAIPAGVTTRAEEAPTSAAWARRRFLIASAATMGGAAVVGALGRSLVEGRAAEAVVVASRLPAALEPAPAIEADQELAVAGITPLVLPAESFFRIDTALVVPRVDVATWRLEVRGMVDRPVELTYDELLELPLVEQHVTIACVSNPVGGHLVGNARWTGVRLREMLEMVGVQDGATQIVGRSVDGFAAGFPTSWALDPARDALVAVAMNGEPLPAKHGFPARLVVPGLYGYVSATKWLATIELTTREAVDGFWIPLGWAKDAPILTQSRIDVPRTGARLAAGPVDVAGVAWAPDRGIAGVEVRIDDGPWQAARIGRPISGATWVQWAFAWDATSGRHAIEVRAIDGTGEVQTDRETEPAPDGARGHHRVTVSVD